MTPRRGLDLDIIVHTAAAIADERGLEEVTLASLAAELGVRSPSLYNHVNGLPELKELLTTLALRRLDDKLASVGDRKPGEEQIMALAEAYSAFAKEHPGLYELTIKAPADGAAVQQELAARLVGRLVAAVEPLGLKEEEAIHAVRGFRSLLHGFASIVQKGGFGMPIDLNVSIRYVMRRYIRGLVAAVDESGSAD